MNILKSYCGIIFLFFFLLNSCNNKEQVPHQSVEIEPGSAFDYFKKGLKSRDPEEKLHYYNEGLKLTNGIEDTTRLLLLDGKIYAFSQLGKRKESLIWIDSLIEAAKFHKDTFFIAKGYYRKGQVSGDLNKPDKAFESIFTARKYNLMSGDTGSAARRSFDLANYQIEMGDYTGSQVSATEALKYLNPQTDSIFISASYNLIGLAYLDQGFYEEAIKEYNNALQYAARTKDSLIFLHNIAIARKNQGKYDEALEILEEIVRSDAPDSSSKARYIDNLAFTYWTKDSTAQIDSLLQEGLEIRKRIDDMEGLHTSYYHLAEYYEGKDKVKAFSYAKKSYEAAVGANAYSAEVKALKKLISLEENNEMSRYIDRYIYLDDSLDRASSRAKFHFAKVRYDEEQKEKQIFDLKVDNFNQALEAERLRDRNIIYLLSILVILLVAGLLLYSFKQRSKRQRLKEIYLTETRMSKRIHDELANDVYNLMSVFEVKGDQEAVNKLDKIYRRTRDISRESSEIDTGKGFASALISNLSSNSGEAKLILRGETSVNWDLVAEEQKVVIYRVLQELLVNMKKHSRASFVAIAFNLSGNNLNIKYSDNGCGMEQDQTCFGNGLHNIQNRLKKVNGKIDFETSPGKGFKANIQIPV